MLLNIYYYNFLCFYRSNKYYVRYEYFVAIENDGYYYLSEIKKQ